jgi:hypothetical protein
MVAADGADRRRGGARVPLLTLVVALVLPVLAAEAEDRAPAPPLLHRSSLEAVLARSGELGLTQDQVKLLEQADARLARKQEEARAALAGAGSDGPGGQPGRQQGDPGAAPGGARAGGMAGAKSRPAPPRREGPGPAELLEQQLDGLDTEAFLQAVAALPADQREKATDVAARHRELLYEQREREKSR